jgi:hypothetical protein
MDPPEDRVWPAGNDESELYRLGVAGMSGDDALRILVEKFGWTEREARWLLTKIGPFWQQDFPHPDTQSQTSAGTARAGRPLLVEQGLERPRE